MSGSQPNVPFEMSVNESSMNEVLTRLKKYKQAPPARSKSIECQHGKSLLKYMQLADLVQTIDRQELEESGTAGSVGLKSKFASFSFQSKVKSKASADKRFEVHAQERRAKREWVKQRLTLMKNLRMAVQQKLLQHQVDSNYEKESQLAQIIDLSSEQASSEFATLKTYKFQAILDKYAPSVESQLRKSRVSNIDFVSSKVQHRAKDLRKITQDMADQQFYNNRRVPLKAEAKDDSSTENY